jgi:hypothetical protein
MPPFWLFFFLTSLRLTLLHFDTIRKIRKIKVKKCKDNSKDMLVLHIVAEKWKVAALGE